MARKKQVVLITMGEITGIGPEICVKTCILSKILKKCIPVLIGDTNALKKALVLLNLPNIKINIINKNFTNLYYKQKIINFLPITNIKNFSKKPTITSAKASFKYIEAALSLIKKGYSDKLVTAPICKEVWHRAGIKYMGHTEALADMTKTKKYAMAFVSPKVRIMLATRHIALKDVSKNLTATNINTTLKLGLKFLDILGIKNKRIGVCGVNPHAGDNGVIAKEEGLIAPLLHMFQRKYACKVVGPCSADDIFHKAINKEIDLVLSMYHDQGILPLKIMDYYKCVNVTVGLPFMRTSPGHGVAFDIAWQNKANPEAMIEAIKVVMRDGASPVPHDSRPS